MSKILSIIPFSGFYESLHDSEIDQTIERMFSDRDTGCDRNEGLESALFDKCDFSAVHRSYAQSYAEAFAAEFKISGLEFESLSSPREYNFTTDRIFVHIPADELARILAATDRKTLSALVREKFTSRDGFISFYSAELENWGPLEEWDHNQTGTLLEAFANQESSDGFDRYAEYYLMESATSNGYLDNWISEATPNIQRLYAIHDYLETRAGRSA